MFYTMDKWPKYDIKKFHATGRNDWFQTGASLPVIQPAGYEFCLFTLWGIFQKGRPFSLKKVTQ